MKPISVRLFLILLIFSCGKGFAQTEDIKTIKNRFEEIKEVLTKDKGNLWGTELYGPLMFVDPGTRNIYTNEQDPSNSLTPADGIFTGKLDERTGIANTALNWKGKNWTMVMLPLPKETGDRRSLIIHELFHNVQEKLGQEFNTPLPNHLEKKDARILLQLEWNALTAAYTGKDSKRVYHISNALLFRNMRRILFPGSVFSENGFEFSEGIPEYTGITLGIENYSDKCSYIKQRVKGTVENSKSFVRSFAYISGALYGLLLDKSGKEWRKEIYINLDLGQLTAKKYSIAVTIPSQKQVDVRKKEYGFEAIEKTEIIREEENNKIAAMYINKYTKEPVLRLPNAAVNYQFNPNEVIAINDMGNYYPTMRVTGKWGILTVERGAFVPSNWSCVIVSAPFKSEGNMVKGDGWELKLDENWNIVAQGNSFTLELKKK